MKTERILFNISAVICYIFGTLYLFTLVFIPIAIYCFDAAKRFAYKADNLLDFSILPNNTLKKYVIFTCIFCFPLGLISIIPYLKISSNNVSVVDVKPEIEEIEDLAKEEIEDLDEELEEKPVEEVEVNTEQTEAEKIEKFEKLKNFHEKGIITDDELEMAREQLFGKKD